MAWKEAGCVDDWKKAQVSQSVLIAASMMVPLQLICTVAQTWTIPYDCPYVDY